MSSLDQQRQPVPPLQTTPAPPAPPDNPQNEEERRQVHRYEQWLVQQDGAINQQLKYYESEIGKLRKQRKVSPHYTTNYFNTYSTYMDYVGVLGKIIYSPKSHFYLNSDQDTKVFLGLVFFYLSHYQKFLLFSFLTKINW
jgi:hypothetical protein